MLTILLLTALFTFSAHVPPATLEDVVLGNGGEIVIVEYVTDHEDYPGWRDKVFPGKDWSRVSAAYDPLKKRIVIATEVHGQSVNSLYHELGHFLWWELLDYETQKKPWREIHSKHEWTSYYECPEEAFAESVAKFFEGEKLPWDVLLFILKNVYWDIVRN